MGIKQLYNDNLRKLPNEYGDVSVMFTILQLLCSKVCMYILFHFCHVLMIFQ